jgi:hypothetical protein
MVTVLGPRGEGRLKETVVADMGLLLVWDTLADRLVDSLSATATDG